MRDGRLDVVVRLWNHVADGGLHSSFSRRSLRPVLVGEGLNPVTFEMAGLGVVARSYLQGSSGSVPFH